MQNCYTPQFVHERTIEEMKQEYISTPSLTRGDGRRPDELRPAYMKTGLNAQALGSAYVEFQQTKVICSVFGPRSDTRRSAEYSESGQLFCDVKFAPFATPPTSTRMASEMEISAMVTQALSPAVMLTKFPKSMLQLFIVILDADGSELGAAITCGSMALVDAAVDMIDVVVASTVCTLGPHIALDPTQEEQTCADAIVTMAYMPSLAEVTYVAQTGKTKYETVQALMELAIDGCAGPIFQLVLIPFQNAVKEMKIPIMK